MSRVSPDRRRTAVRLAAAAVGALALTAVGADTFLPASIARATTVITVTTTGDETASNGTCSLREAITAANTDQAVDACPAGSGTDTIVVPAGTHLLSIAGNGENGNATGDLDITSSVNISASGATVDAGGIDRVLEVMAGATVTITGGTLRNGFMPTLDYSTGSGYMGAGIHNAGTLTLDNVTVSDNVGDYSATQGPFGGAGIGNEGTLTVLRSRITNNHLGQTYPDGSAGGILNNGTLSLTDTTVSGNSSFSDGGGLGNNGVATIARSTFTGNSTGCYECTSRGGAIYNGGTITVTNSTLSGNSINAGDYSAGGNGAGLYNNGTATLDNLTIAGNTVDHYCDSHCFQKGAGGGVYGGTTTTLSNSIISGNTVTETYSPPWGLPPETTAWDCAGTVNGGYDLIQTTANCTYTAGTGDVVGADPMLGKLQGNGGWTMTQEPHPGSPAIDRGNPAAAGSGGTACLATDQRGMPRSDDGNVDGTQRCDIGAVEAEAMDSTWYRVRLDGWAGTGDSNASGGGYRSASTAGATATFSEQGSTATSSVGFMTYKGPNMGRAAITVDGVYVGTIDLYASALTRKNYNYSTASALSHTVVVKVLGTKSTASSGTEVRVDAFRRGTTIVEDNSPSVRFGYWAGGRSGQALNGSYRIGSAGGTLTFDTAGPVFTFITERGPSFGKAQVRVDGVVKGTIDAYAPTTQWLSRQTYSGVGAGTHHVVITVLGTKNAASTGTAMVFDAITLR